MKKLYGVIGNPIEHSMSPLMQNDAFMDKGISAYYHPFKILPEFLGTALKGMKALGVSGFNVTIPYKTAVMPFLDKLDPLAEAIGAVNTVVLEEDQWVGYNSDGPGFVRSLKEDWKSEWQNEKTLIIGAGGAAKAIYYSMAKEGMPRIDICNRTLERAASMKASCPFPCESNIMNIEQAEKQLSEYTLIIQTTSIGMDPLINDSPLSLEHMNDNAYAADIIYNPFETKFLREAREKGAEIQNGIGMFIYQGAIAFEKWTGVSPDMDRMRKLVTARLGGK
ncbi:shikimate dehydrogenase [Heyndrickxia acidicola]|uniref:Shikimate dehydrogenase (NADP(+)) n=1 Tax=Heyndrickxia acidicola TaxID=209389 RepID=A0ABU6MKP6_9BACI|nr:shikimate dehydrogenase [Heyndrickxia acidicola]MED1205059.1 shikimate dehydrogenase [Heyndrickxia acidicola]